MKDKNTTGPLFARKPVGLWAQFDNASTIQGQLEVERAALAKCTDKKHARTLRFTIANLLNCLAWIS
jgi:hypothetical protein